MANQPGVPDAQLLPKAEDAVAEWQSNTEIEDRSEAFADAVGDEDDFADFGEPDDFGDFGHLESVPVSAKDPGPTLESTLEQASALIHRTDGRSSPSPVLAQCMECIFGELDGETCEEQSQQGVLLPAVEVDSAVADALDGAADLGTSEPQLLTNLLRVATDPGLSVHQVRELLVPSEPAQLAEASAKPSGSGSADVPMLTIDEIRRIAAQATYSPESQAGEKSRLHHALESLRLLVAAKEQEAAKRRDSVLAYNQVIQTLVAQASKLH